MTGAPVVSREESEGELAEENRIDSTRAWSALAFSRFERSHSRGRRPSTVRLTPLEFDIVEQAENAASAQGKPAEGNDNLNAETNSQEDEDSRGEVGQRETMVG